MSTFAVVDIETTGGNFHQDRIIEVAVVIHNGVRVVAEYTSLVNPEKPIQPFISRLTGISNKMVKSAPTFEDIAEELADVLKGHVFVAHNVRFDYGFIKASFKRAGISYRAPHFCTVELSREIFPGHPSYSLGKLSKSMGISVAHRHRAFGDAAATAELLGRMVAVNPERIRNAAWGDELDRAHVPAQLNKDVLDRLPEELGVYALLDEEGRTLFCSKAKNIRQSVIAHFKVPLEEQTNALTAFVADVEYHLTGNEAIAAMLEQKIIIDKQPRFNKPIRKPNYKYGIIREYDESGYLNLKVIHLQHTDAPVLSKFSSLQKAEKWLSHIHQKLQGSQVLKSASTPEVYNRYCEDFIRQSGYPLENCCIVDEGRKENEKALIWIEAFQCVGFSYSDGAFSDFNVLYTRNGIVKADETPELKRILMQYIRKRRNRIKVLPLSQQEDTGDI
jgi:DNA polymerase III subunit epsilon